MRPLSCLLLTPIFAHASPALHVRDDMHFAQSMSEINETEILQWHLPTPPSYWSIDIDDRDPNIPRYPALIALHALFMSLAFFVALPAGIALRSVKHSFHGVAVVSFYSLMVFGCVTSSLYRKLTPDMYEGSTHSTHGYLVLLLSLALSAVDIAAFFARLYAFCMAPSKLTLRQFWRSVVLGHQHTSSGYSGIVSEDPEEYADIKPTSSRPVSSLSERVVFDVDSPQSSRHSDDTLHDIMVTPIPPPKQPLLRRISQVAYSTLERSLVFAAFAMILSGIIIYTGGCRDSYINGCLAHLIKGGIFWCYGLFTFARFLGSHSEMGWAWNISPIGNTISAEFVESTVIFLYGISNTWMERFGAKPGDPYTTKQVQHISIAVRRIVSLSTLPNVHRLKVMFWFAGLVGMGMESRRVRRWLAASATASLGLARTTSITEPPSYRASFNPFPALVIGVTGAAMSAHAQAYVFQVSPVVVIPVSPYLISGQVQVHELWGWLLLGFSVLRCLTYFFLWLGPPESVLPSRPPTEVLGSFFLACGGLMFMFSTEELTLAAMRKGRDGQMVFRFSPQYQHIDRCFFPDMMMFLNVAVAITCFAFCWTLCVVTFNGWLKARKTMA
ncbi:hypothetical protein JVT61DRAFT_13146 [Boletus reticuloceps]|uniref:Uncharacterized protein n=1 Tax=Boletus reticuloceps TaxID=495285 RepID=A0A8I2YUX7_9AGAM|nr:hypothetical protein JVT61DRAFT_13146 [Boletus reticuloceps]